MNEKNQNIENERARKALLSLLEDQKLATQKLQESEELFRTLAESTSTAIFIYQKDKFIYVNKATEVLTGYSAEELLSIHFWEIIHPDQREFVKQRGIARQKGENVPTRYEIKLIKKNDEIAWVDFSAAKIIWKGEPAAIGSAFDITERKIAEQKLKDSEEKYRLIAENTADTISVFDMNLNYIYISPSVKKLLGYTPEELTNLGYKVILTKETEELILEELKKELEKEKDENIDKNRTITLLVEEIKKDGSKIWAEVTSSFIRDKNGFPTAILTTSRDVTERVNLQFDLALSEKKFRELFENHSAVKLIIDPNNGQIVDANKAASLFYGYSIEQLKTMNINQINILSVDEIQNRMNFAKNKKQNYFEFKHRLSNGKIIDVEVYSSPVVIDNKTYLHLIIHDITEKKKAESELRENEEKLRLLVEGTSNFFFYTQNIEGFVTYISPTVEQITGYKPEEWYNQRHWFATDNPINDNAPLRTRKHLAGEKIKEPLYFELYHKNGNKVLLEIYEDPIIKDGKVVGLQGVATDITEKKRAEVIQNIQYNIANAVVTSKTLNELFEVVRKELSSLIDTKNFFIAFYDEENDLLRSNIDKDEKDEIPVWSAKKSLTGYVIKKRNSLLLSKQDILELSNKGEIDLIGTLPETWLGVPLIIGDKVIGVLAVQDYQNKNAYDKHSLEVLEIISKQLSIYIEQKRTEEKILKLSIAVEQSPISIVITDINGNIEYVNPKFCEVSGYNIKEVVGKNPRILKSGKTNPEVYDELWKTITSGNSWNGEFINKKKNGEIYYETANISPLKNEYGVITNFVAVKEDITEKKKLYDDLIQSEERFRSIWENSIDAMRLIDEEGIIVDVNLAFCKLFGLTKNELIGKPISILYYQQESTVDIYKERYRTNTIPQKMEKEAILHNNKKLWLDVSNAKIEIKGYPSLLLSIFRDITDKKKMIQELITAKEKAEEMNRLKSHFFATMSHELRTPFVGIMGFAEMLFDEVENPEHKDMAGRIIQASKRLTNTLNQILDMTKLEFDKQELNITNFDAIQVVDDVYLQFEKSAKIKKIELRRNIKLNSLFIDSDEKLFSEILINLVNNAIKYTDKGWIEIYADKKIENKKEYFVVEIRDTGIGIPKEKQELIWEDFRQASEGTSRKYEGTGLGLSIAKRFAKIIKANLYLKDSKPGVGSTFVLEIPIQSDFTIQKEEDSPTNIINEPKEFQPEKISFEKRKILYVEDDQMAIDIVKRTLSQNYVVDCVTNSKDALKKIDEINYDLIFIDINLGRDGLNGIQLTEEIRKIDRLKKIPIVALTAYAREEDKNEFLSKGMDYYLSKPFTISDLRKLVSDIFSK